MKLTSAGFTVTRNPESPHDLVLMVEYREDRGKPLAFNLSGTVSTCRMVLEHPEQGRLVSMSIRESPQYAKLITAPYVEVVEQLQAKPYFYFLGDLIRGRIDPHLDTTGALIQAVERQFNRDEHHRIATPLDTLESPAETFPDLDLPCAGWAWENAIEELGRLKDPRPIDLLERLMFHSDWRIRLRAVLALGEFNAPSIAPAMRRVAQTDSDTGVREATATMLARSSRP